MKLWRAIARCKHCRKLLNTAENIPDNKKTQVILSAPMVALCDILEHNTTSDLNLGVVLEWSEMS